MNPSEQEKISAITQAVDRLNSQGLLKFADWCEDSGFEELGPPPRRMAYARMAEEHPVHNAGEGEA